MKEVQPDTIAAIATGAGRAAVGIVRLSGPQAFDIARSLCGELPEPRVASLRKIRDESGAVVDQALLILFPGPKSYTGEDVVELQGHGGSGVLNEVLDAALATGARRARPGEFSERAFLNDRLDLAQAEAVADLIDATSRNAVIAANRSLQGDFSKQVHRLAEQLLEIRVFVEGSMDFSDEEIDWLNHSDLQLKIASAATDIDALLKRASQGRRLNDGLILAIVGEPNVGKSTLLNALAGTDAAIVSEIAGTTRDSLRERLMIGDLPVEVIDTAGLRETDNPIEREGIRRTWKALAEAELILHLLEDSQESVHSQLEEIRRQAPEAEILQVRTKCDLSGEPPSIQESDGLRIVRLSAATGAGMNLLRQSVLEFAGVQEIGEGALSARSRHLDALTLARENFQSAVELIKAGAQVELAAEELNQANQALGSIVGHTDSEALLGAVFSRFCIGK